MTCNGSFAGSFFFWATLSGCFTGFALSRLTRPAVRGSVLSHNWKWIAFSSYLSVGVLLALAAAFVPSSFCIEPVGIRVSPAFLDIRILYIFLAGLVLGFVGLGFKRAAGIPLLVILALVTTMAISITYPWRPVDRDRPVAEVRLLSIASGRRSIEFTPDSGDTYFYELDGPGIRFRVITLDVSDYYFFVEKPFMYRFDSVSAAGNDKVTVSLDNHRTAGSSFQKWLQHIGVMLPGWDAVPLTVEADRLLPLFRYAIYLTGENGPRIELVAPKK